jgi:putative addiction module antidote
MATALKLRRIGNSVGVILPRETLARMRVDAGDTIHMTDAPDNSVRLSPYDPVFERQMAVARQVMKRNRNVLRALAKN